MNTDRECDAVIRVIDFDRVNRMSDYGPSGKGYCWYRTDNQPIISPDELDSYEEIEEEAHERYDIDDLDHHDVVARIWLSDRAVEAIEWEHSL